MAKINVYKAQALNRAQQIHLAATKKMHTSMFLESIILLAILLPQLTGCASWTMSHLPDQSDGHLAVISLDLSDKNGIAAAGDKHYDAKLWTIPTADLSDKDHPIGKRKLYLMGLVEQSRKKCGDFQRRLYANMQDINATGDILTSLFSATATITKPLNAIHTLTGISTFTSATKSTINADVFNNATVLNIARAISIMYDANMTAYSDALASAPVDQDNNIDIPTEVNKILAIHGTCNVATALTGISNAISSAGSSTNGVSVAISFSPPSDATAGQPITMTVLLGNSGSGQATLTSDFKLPLVAQLKPNSSNVESSSTCSGATLDGQNIVLPAKSTLAASSATNKIGGCAIAVTVTSDSAGSQIVQTVAAGTLITDKGSNTASSQFLNIKAPGSANAESTSKVALEFSNVSTTVNTPVLLTITLGAGLENPDTTTDKFVTTFSPRLLVTKDAKAGGDCVSGSNKVSLNAGNSGITLATGAKIPKGGCRIIVAVESVAEGNYTASADAKSLKLKKAGPNANAATSQTLSVSATATGAKSNPALQTEPDKKHPWNGTPSVKTVEQIFTR